MDPETFRGELKVKKTSILRGQGTSADWPLEAVAPLLSGGLSGVESWGLNLVLKTSFLFLSAHHQYIYTKQSRLNICKIHRIVRCPAGLMIILMNG